jgi:Holliday junction resolvase-like predicted endonuclease
MNLKKYNQFILESTGVDNSEIVYNKLNRLKFFLVDSFYKPDKEKPERPAMGMKNIINKRLEKLRTYKNYNDQYQYALGLLSRTGKFPNIKMVDGKWFDPSLSNQGHVLDEEGNWHPVNKLNTNYSDIARLLTTVFTRMKMPDGVRTVADKIYSIDNEEQLKDLLLRFSNSKDDLIGKFINDDELKTFIENNRKNTIIGDISENKVKDVLESKGMKALYQGGDGDFIDILYGIDLIMESDDKVYLVQVKTRPEDAKKAFKESSRNNYKKIDWFCSPYGKSVINYNVANPEGEVF